MAISSIQPPLRCVRAWSLAHGEREMHCPQPVHWDHPSSWGRFMAAWGFSLAQASGFSRTELRVSLPGPGLPEFSRPRTILGNLCAQGTTNMFVFIQHSLLCLSQTPPFGRNHNPWRKVPVGFGEFLLYLNEVLPLVFVKSFQKKSFL